MDPQSESDHYARLAEAHATWMAMPEEDRAHWFADLEREDLPLARELGELVTASESGAELFADSSIERRDSTPLALPFPEEDEGPPATIGPYRVLRRLGAGGMGIVYEAEQEAPHRRVALKVIHPELAFGERLRRFRHEAEAQGRLKHPGIAQIYDTGTCDLGRGEQPYLVMELVEGDALLAHCQRERLDRRARLELLAKICDAVQHAHEHGVIHRDLKPDNVLLDLDGQPKVLDFGIARVDTDETPLTTIHTAQGDLVGTLTHMAPEQLAGDPEAVGPASDVYALGVMAFELLTGRLPHQVAGLPITQAMRTILEEDAPRLGRMDRSLRGDQETIVGKALAQEPKSRYVSAAALASDLRRFLAHEPIAARRPGSLYRAGRFARRKPALVGGTLATLLALTAGIAGVLTFAGREADSRRNAERAGIDALAVTLASIQATLDDGEAWRARELLDRVAPGIRGWEWGWLDRRCPYFLEGLAHPSEFFEHSLIRPVPREPFDWACGVTDLADPLKRTKVIPLGGSVSGLSPAGGKLFVIGERNSADECVRMHFLDAESRAIVESYPNELPAFFRRLADDGTLLRADGHVTLRAERNKPDSARRIQPPSGEQPHWYPDLSEDGSHVAWGTTSPALVLLDARSGELVARHPTAVAPFVHFLAGSDRIACILPGSLEVLSVPALEPLLECSIPLQDISWIASAEDGTLAVSTTGQGILVIDSKTGELREHLDSTRYSVKRTEYVALSRDGRFLSANAGDTDGAWIHEIGAPPARGSLVLQGKGRVLEAGFSPDGTMIAGLDDSGARFWDAGDGSSLSTLPWPEGTRVPGSSILSFSSDGSRLVCVALGPDGVVLVIFDLLLGQHRTTDLVEVTDDEGFTSAFLESLVRELGEPVGGRKGSQLSFVPGAERAFQAFSGTVSRSVVDRPQWGVAKWGEASAIGLSSDGSLLACADRACVRVVEAESGAPVALPLEARADMEFLDVAWSPDGSRLAATREDGRLFLVETQYYREVLELAVGGPSPRGLAWSPDGTRLLAIAGDQVRLYDSAPAIPRRLQTEARKRLAQESALRLRFLIESHPTERVALEALHRESDEGRLPEGTTRRAALEWLGGSQE